MKTRKELLDILTKTEEEQALFIRNYDFTGILMSHRSGREVNDVKLDGHWEFNRLLPALAFELRDMAVKKDIDKFRDAVVDVYKAVNGDMVIDVKDVDDWAWVLEEVAFGFTPFQFIVASLLVLDCEKGEQ